MNSERLYLLIVEDEEAHVDAIRRAFEAAGSDMEIRSVATLREFHAAVQECRPDLALMDLNLPDGQAVEALAQPLEDAPFPIMIMTAFGNQQVVVEVMKAGALDYVVKSPESFATMPRTVEQALREWTLIQKHKQASDALMASEQRYHTFVESTSDLVFLKDEAFRYLISNSANNAFLEKSEADVLGHTDFDIMPEEAARHCRASDEQALEAGTRIIHEESVGLNFYQTFKFPVLLPGGQTGVGGFIRDITLRRQSEEQLKAVQREANRLLTEAQASRRALLGMVEDQQEAGEKVQRNEELLQKIFDLLPVGLWFANKEGQLQRGNPAGVKIWGAEPKVAPADYGVFKARRLPTREEIPPEDWALAHTIQDGATIENELLEIDAFDGVTRTILNSTAPVLDDEGAIQGAIIVNQDITDLKQAEEALRSSEAKSRSILDNISIGVALISPDMEILELNRQMQQWFPDVEVGQHPICYRAFNSPPREALCTYCPTVTTLKDGQVHEAETETPTPDGIRNYRIVSSPIFNEEGAVTAAIELVEDVTDKSALESQLRQAQKMESVGRLAGGVAHDFNNMLGVILGHAEMALELENESEPLLNNLTEIRKAAERSANLTRQLLAFARKQTVSPKVLDLNETIGGMYNMLRRLIGENITLGWHPGSDLWPIRMDPSQIDQIVVNLCVNARDAINGVGQITIETDQDTFDATACVTCPGFSPGDFVRLTIRDSGAGMDAETLGHIFEPFFTTKGLGEGTGLGLATVYGAVQQNNGFLKVSSEPGQGTTFEIYLPRHRTAGSIASAAGATSVAHAGDETILLVEDEAAILEMTTQMLEQLGYNVLAADTPGKAIRMARDHSGTIDLLLTDVVMPEMNGRDLAKNILSLYPEVKRLFMSGYTADVIAHQGVLDPGVHFVQKPFNTHTLTAKIRETLDADKAED